MAIKTVLLGTMGGGGGEGWVFQPSERTRYYLPKGDYTFLVVTGPYGTKVGLTSSDGKEQADSENFTATRSGIEWVEFTGPIGNAAIIPGDVLNKTPKSTDAPVVSSKGEFKLNVLYKRGDTVTVSDQQPRFNGVYECLETHTSSYYYYPWNGRLWKKLA
ncbi:hypothetical protein [Corynebacterium striatum]|uniref:hypothetical protein n=1 Tax=Corynebacterium striatum TaxID=43770 RepID=UPI0027BAB0B8|nr:hypothetical protein [Corynebacterium striatum]